MEFESTIRNIHQEVKFKAFDGEMFTDSITCKSYEFHQLFMQTFGERFDISKSYRKIIRSFNDIEESVFKIGYHTSVIEAGSNTKTGLLGIRLILKIPMYTSH